MYHIRIEDSFAAAHFLKDYHGKCENLHGHNYKIRVHAAGNVLDTGGMLVDFGVVKNGLRKVLSTLDHTNLNEHPAFRADQNPSAERIAEYIFKEMRKVLPDAPINKVEVFETEKNLAAYTEDTTDTG